MSEETMDLGTLFRALIGQQVPSGPPQAYTRVTHTPVRWGPLDEGTYGQYVRQGGGGSIVMNQNTLPQVNAPHADEMSNVLRHESVHALLPEDVINHIMQYFTSRPAQLAQAQSNLGQIDPQAASSVRGTAQEAPAYLMMGRRLGMGDNVEQDYMNQMPTDIRQKYAQLMKGGGR